MQVSLASIIPSLVAHTGPDYHQEWIPPHSHHHRNPQWEKTRAESLRLINKGYYQFCRNLFHHSNENTAHSPAEKGERNYLRGLCKLLDSTHKGSGAQSDFHRAIQLDNQPKYYAAYAAALVKNPDNTRLHDYLKAYDYWLQLQHHPLDSLSQLLMQEVIQKIEAKVKHEMASQDMAASGLPDQLSLSQIYRYTKDSYSEFSKILVAKFYLNRFSQNYHPENHTQDDNSTYHQLWARISERTRNYRHAAAHWLQRADYQTARYRADSYEEACQNWMHVKEYNKALQAIEQAISLEATEERKQAKAKALLALGNRTAAIETYLEIDQFTKAIEIAMKNNDHKTAFAILLNWFAAEENISPLEAKKGMEIAQSYPQPVSALRLLLNLYRGKLNATFRTLYERALWKAENEMGNKKRMYHIDIDGHRSGPRHQMTLTLSLVNQSLANADYRLRFNENGHLEQLTSAEVCTKTELKEYVDADFGLGGARYRSDIVCAEKQPGEVKAQTFFHDNVSKLEYDTENRLEVAMHLTDADGINHEHIFTFASAHDAIRAYRLFKFWKVYGGLDPS